MIKRTVILLAIAFFCSASAAFAQKAPIKNVYETEDGNLVAVADAVRSENIVELLDKSSAACAAMYADFLGKSGVSIATAVSVPTNSEYKNFSTGRRIGAMIVNVVPGYLIPGLGSAVFMRDWKGVGIALATQGTGMLLIIARSEPLIPIGPAMFLSGVTHSAFIRPWYYKKPTPKTNKTSDISPYGNFNFGVLPDKDSGYKLVALYDLSF
jgi:hypothetical protein